MGTGVTSSLLPPDSFALAIFADHFVTARSSLGHVSQYAPSLIPCVPCPPRTCLRAHSESWYPQIRITLQVRSLTFFAIFWPSSRSISIGQLHTLLHFHLRPIYVIVYDVPYSSRDERSYLRESFTLRCFQRLSRPHLATQLCRWRDNWCTRGASIPVLSY